MTESTKTYLIIGGVALVAFLIYKRTTIGNRASPVVHSTAGTGQSVSASTGQGAAGGTSFWDTLGSVGKGLNSGVSAVESTYNSVYDLFGGNSTSTAPTGNNGTAG